MHYYYAAEEAKNIIILWDCAHHTLMTQFHSAGRMGGGRERGAS